RIFHVTGVQTCVLPICVVTEHGVLHFVEIADVNSRTEGRGGAHASERTDAASGTDARAIDHAIWQHLRVVLDLRVADVAVRSDAHAIAETHVTLEHDVHVDHAIRAV